MRRIGTNSSHMRIHRKVVLCELVGITCLSVSNGYQILTQVKNLKLSASTNYGLCVKNWNQMQNAVALGEGVLYRCEEYA